MHALTARQCPQCVLRFGSSSELDQHLRLDHQPVPKAREEIRPVPEPQVELEDRAATAPAGLGRVDTVIIAGAVIAFVALLSWQVAAVLSLAIAVAAAVRAATRTDSSAVTK